MPEWRSAWTKLFEHVDTVRSFSDEAANLFLRGYPEAKEKVVVEAHSQPRIGASVPFPKASDPLVVGVIGNIGIAKGASVIAKLAKHTNTRIVVIGRITPKPAPREGVIIHGGYHPEELRDLILRYHVTLGFIPSLWPETYNIVADEVMQLGLPLVSFDIGAQAERIKNYKHGRVLPLETHHDPAKIRDALSQFYAGVVGS